MPLGYFFFYCPHKKRTALKPILVSEMLANVSDLSANTPYNLSLTSFQKKFFEHLAVHFQINAIQIFKSAY